MAGSGNRAGSGRAAGPAAAAAPRLTAKDRAAQRESRLFSVSSRAFRQVDQLQQRRRSFGDSAFARSLDRRIQRRQQLISRVEAERSGLRNRAYARGMRLQRMKRRTSTAPDFPANWPTGRRLYDR